MKRLLFVTYYFPPIGGMPVVRALKFVKYLSRSGWDITVLTVKKAFEEPFDESQLGEIPDSVRVLRAVEPFSIDRLYKRLRGLGRALSGGRVSSEVSSGAARSTVGEAAGLRRFVENTVTFPDKKNLWYPGAVFAGMKFLRSNAVDAVLAQGYPWTSLVAGARLARMCAKPLVSDLRDAWSLNPKKLWDTARQRRAERKVFERSSKIVVVSDRMRGAYAAAYPDLEDRFVTITNGWDPDDFLFPDDFAHLPKMDEKLVITYTGSVVDHVPPSPWHRSPYYFLHGLRSALDREPGVTDDIMVNFVGGFGDRGGPNERLIAELGLGGVVNVVGFVERAHAVDYQINSNVLLLIVNTAPGSEHILTGKVFEYLAARKFILALAPKGEVRDLIKETGSGLAVDPSDPEEIAEALLSLHRKWKEKADIFNRTGDDDAVRRYNRGTLAGKLDETLTSALKS